jgi:pimeloyl-ACP methyl ester carboxylesterase
MASTIFPQAWLRQTVWQGMPMAYVEAPPAVEANSEPLSTVVLIHGFGACKEHWRHTVPHLQRHHRVLALDLIGFGDSAKPRSRLDSEGEDGQNWRYGIGSWGQQVHDLVVAQGQGPVQLIGNSIGGVVALSAAMRLEQSGHPASQVVLIDCAQRALDDRRLAEQPPLRRLGRPLLKLLVRQRWLTNSLYRTLVNPALVRRVLLQAYPTGSNVDDELVELLLRPARQPGAAEAFRGFINLFNDSIAPDFLEILKTPVAMLWGERDPWEPIAIAETWTRYACVTALERLPQLGHCPHDENPALVNEHLSVVLQRGATPAC